MSDFQTTTDPVARKRHTCCECRGCIEPGKKYQLVSGCWDGYMESYKTCMPCVLARNWATKQPEWPDDGEHKFYFETLETELASLAPEIHVGDGRRFRAYRLQLQLRRRRHTACNQKAA